MILTRRSREGANPNLLEVNLHQLPDKGARQTPRNATKHDPNVNLEL